MDALKRIVKSRVNLVLQEPFFGTLALRLKSELGPVGTACTDGTRIVYDPEFVSKLTEQQLNTVIAHEVMHCALLHHTRGAKMADHRLANMAADHAVNWALQRAIEGGARCFAWPTDPEPLKDPRFKDSAFEEIYRTLLGEQPEPQGGGGQGPGKSGKGNGAGEGQGDDPGGMGGFEPPKPEPGDKPGKGDKESTDPRMTNPARQSEEDWKEALVQAAQAAKLQGKLPAGMEGLVDSLLAPKISWQHVLREFVTVAAKDDWSWNKPNRRMLAHGHYLPGLHSQRCGHVIVAVDTSGSCLDHIPQFLGEVQAILDEVRPDRLTVMDIDAALGNVADYAPGDKIRTEFNGGGGTDFRPPFQHIAANGMEPVCMVYLTDLYGTFPEHAPDYPVLWVVTTDQAVPFGEVVRMI